LSDYQEEKHTCTERATRATYLWRLRRSGGACGRGHGCARRPPRHSAPAAHPL